MVLLLDAFSTQILQKLLTSVAKKQGSKPQACFPGIRAFVLQEK